MKISKFLILCITFLLYVNVIQNVKPTTAICESNYGTIGIYIITPIPEVRPLPALPPNDTSSYYPTNNTVYGSIIHFSWELYYGGDVMYVGNSSCIIQFTLTINDIVVINDTNMDIEDVSTEYDYEVTTPDIHPYPQQQINLTFYLYYYDTTSTPQYTEKTKEYNVIWDGITPPSTSNGNNGDVELNIYTILIIVGIGLVTLFVVFYLIQRQNLQKRCNPNSKEGIDNLWYDERCYGIRDKLISEGKIPPESPEVMQQRLMMESMMGSPQFQPNVQQQQNPIPKKKYIGLTDEF